MMVARPTDENEPSELCISHAQNWQTSVNVTEVRLIYQCGNKYALTSVGLERRYVWTDKENQILYV